ncbi:MAG TPA: flagellar biosynthesis protein FlgB [Acetobacteraceae bacterium]|jgi:flagellar basal-body rod protein FlgB|nr:flagellar biosynthesis protein FlgB [Acetobacteraceae bacterium]
MDPTRIALFDLADQRLSWVGRREQLLAQNVANADTPGWRARDLKPFAELLAGRAVRLAPVTASPGALPLLAATPPGSITTPGDAGPDGNSVQLDTELAKVADSETTQSLVTGLYAKYLGMFRTALGR